MRNSALVDNIDRWEGRGEAGEHSLLKRLQKIPTLLSPQNHFYHPSETAEGKLSIVHYDPM